MMTLGVRAHDYGKRDAESLFSAISADGWKTVQLACKKALTGCDNTQDLTDTFLKKTQSALTNAGLDVAVLGCYIEPSLTGEADRRQHVADFVSHMPAAKLLNAGCIGTETTNMDKLMGATRREALACLRRSMETILPEAERLGIAVAVEPVYYHALATPEDTRELLRDMASKQLKVIFDPVNLLSPEDIVGQHRLWNRCFDCFIENVAAVHVKGVRLENGVPIQSPLRESIVDLKYIFAELRQLAGNLPVLREEAVPAAAADDSIFLNALL